MSNANEPDRVNTGALATTTGIVGCAALGIALFVTSLVREETRVVGDARQGTQERSVRELRAEQLGVLDASPTWKDRAAGVVTLPIGRAMDWMLESVRKDPKALSPWQPPAPEALGGAGPEGASSDASEVPSGTGGASGSSAAASAEAPSAAPTGTAPARTAPAPQAPGAPAAPKAAASGASPAAPGAAPAAP